MMAFPKLRFKNAEGAEFTSWVTSFIGDECKITTGNKDTQNKIDGGKYPFFVRSQTVERINTYSKDCEAILTSGDGVGVGKNYHYINGKFDFHQRVYCLYDFSNQLLGKYLYIYFSNYFFDRVKRLSAKNSVDSVRMDMISKMEIKLPSLVEQTKIASFLSAVDEKVSQLTQKHQLLSQYKQGMMQKLFSQQIRFKADDGSEYGEWDFIELGEALSYEQPTKYIVSSTEYLDTYPTPVLTAGKSFILGYTNEQTGIFDASNNNVIIFDDFTTAYKFVNFRFKVKSSAMKILKTNPAQNNIYYLYSTFSTLNFPIGEEHKRRWISEYSKQEIPLPCLAEQTKIANFLSAIDQKIEVTSQQIEQAKQWKKGLLQQMFV